MNISEVATATWTVGFQGRGDPFECFKELQKIKRANGGVLEAGTVVDNSVSEISPLHANFTWDDSVAGRKYREEEARRVVRSIEVVMKPTKGVVARSMKAFQSVSKSPTSETRQRVYVNTDNALEDVIMRDEVLARAIKEALAFRKKYAELSELAKVFIAIDETLAAGEVV